MQVAHLPPPPPVHSVTSVTLAVAVSPPGGSSDAKSKTWCLRAESPREGKEEGEGGREGGRERRRSGGQGDRREVVGGNSLILGERQVFIDLHGWELRLTSHVAREEALSTFPPAFVRKLCEKKWSYLVPAKGALPRPLQAMVEQLGAASLCTFGTASADLNTHTGGWQGQGVGTGEHVSVMVLLQDSELWQAVCGNDDTVWLSREQHEREGGGMRVCGVGGGAPEHVKYDEWGQRGWGSGKWGSARQGECKLIGALIVVWLES
jgi:hypothetical protein